MGKRQAGFGAVYRRRDGQWEGQLRIPGGRRRSFTGTADATSSKTWPRLAGRWARDCQSVPERIRCVPTSNTGCWSAAPTAPVHHGHFMPWTCAALLASLDVPLRWLTPGLILPAVQWPQCIV